MRNISFAYTTDQFLAGTKTVTRRLGWKFLKAGDKLRGVRKAMGLKKGEKMEPLGTIEIVDVRSEPLNRITREDVVLEGFPALSPAEFVDMYCEHARCAPDAEVRRIEFRVLEYASN